MVSAARPGVTAGPAAGGRVVVLAAGILPILLITDLQIFAVVLAAAVIQLGVLRLRVRRENDYRLFKERRLARINEMRFLLRHHFHQLLGIEGQGRVMPRYWAMRDEGIRLEVGEARLQLRYRVVHHVLEHLALLVVAALVGVQVLNGRISIGAFTMVLMYTHQLMGALSSIHDSIGEWYRSRAVFCQLGFYLRLRPRVDLTRSEPPGTPPQGEIQVSGLAFRYPSFSAEEQKYLAYLIEVLKLSNEKRAIWQVDSELVKDWRLLLEQGTEELPLVLDGVDCTFRQGELTALVGRNGSGKTTLLNLLLRAYDPQKGQIRLAGTPLYKLHPRDLRRCVSLVPQQPFLLESFSLRDNLLLGNEELSFVCRCCAQRISVLMFSTNSSRCWCSCSRSCTSSSSWLIWARSSGPKQPRMSPWIPARSRPPVSASAKSRSTPKEGSSSYSSMCRRALARASWKRPRASSRSPSCQRAAPRLRWTQENSLPRARAPSSASAASSGRPARSSRWPCM